MAQPPFLLTYYNPFSDDPKKSSLVGSYLDYVKNTSLAKYSADVVGNYLEETSQTQLEATESIGRAICGDLYDGFSKLQSQVKKADLQHTRQLGQISGQLQQVVGVLDGVNQRLELLRDEVKTSNVLLENIGELLRIPDSQKQRQHHVEMALRFLKNARKNQDLYQDALQDLLDAEKLKRDDLFVLHRIGMIYLYAPDLINLEKALDYFIRAAKYAAVESDPDAARLSNVLNKRVTEKFADQADRLPDKESPDETTKSFEDSISALAAESYFQAGTALYALGRFDEAVKMAEKAVTQKKYDAKHLFYLAKYLARSGKTDLAITHLQKAINAVPEMAIAALGDFDLNRKQPVLDLLESLNKNAISELQSGIQRLNKWSEVVTDSGVLRWITTTEESLKESSYPVKQTLLSELENYDIIMPDVIKVIALFNEYFIGQRRIKTQLALEINNSSHPPQQLGHILLVGSVGIGKATLADVIANIAGKNIFAWDASQLKTASDLLGILPPIVDGELVHSFPRIYEDGEILLIAGIDKLESHLLDILRSAMNDFAYSVVIDKGRSCRLSYRKFTLIGTALSTDKLSGELLSSFSMTGCFESYSKDEIISITRRLAPQLEIDPELAVRNMVGFDHATPKDIFESLSELKKREEQRKAEEIIRLKSEAEAAEKEERNRRELEAAEKAIIEEENEFQIESKNVEKVRMENLASHFLDEAKAAEETEKAKWFRKKDFSNALELYKQAAEAGSTEAVAKVGEMTRLINQ